MSLTDEQYAAFLESLLGPQKIRNDQGEIDFGDPVKRIEALKESEKTRANLLAPSARRALIGSLGSRLQPPGVDS